MEMLFKRPDGSFVAVRDGWPYHITAEDPLFDAAREAAQKLGSGLAFEPEPLQPELTVADYETAIQARVDEVARSRQFRDGVTMASYAVSTNPVWAAEAQAFIAWRDEVWAYADSSLARVEDGERAQPSIEEFISELPSIIWP
jgi:hypothetical protein